MSDYPYCLAAAVLSLLFVAGDAQAGKNASLKLGQGVYKIGGAKPAYGPKLPINGPVIKVYAESGTHYSHVANTHKKLKFLTKYTASCSGKRKVSGLSVKIADEVGSGSDKGGGYETGYAVVEVPYGKLTGLKPAQWCNNHLTTLSLEKNQSKKAIVKKGFTLYIPDVVEARGTVFCSHKVLRGSTSGDNAKLGVWVSCEAKPNVDRPTRKTSTKKHQPDTGKTTTIFKSATLAAASTRLEGKSPQQLQLTGKIAVTGAGTIRAQMVGSGGFETPVREFKFTGAGLQEMRFTHYVRKKDPGKTLAGSASQSGDKVNGWVVLKVWYPVRNKIARAEKLYTTPKLNYSVDFSPEPKPARLKKAQ